MAGKESLARTAAPIDRAKGSKKPAGEPSNASFRRGARPSIVRPVRNRRFQKALLTPMRGRAICPPLFPIPGRPMPNIASSRKRVRTTAKRTAINTSRKTRVRGFIRKVEEAIAKGDKTAALAALKAAEPEIMRGVTKGVLHKNTGARKVSRLTKRVAKLQK